MVLASVDVWEDDNANGVVDGTESLYVAGPGVYSLSGIVAQDETRTVTVRVNVAATAIADSYQTYGLVAAVASGGTNAAAMATPAMAATTLGRAMA